MDGPVSGEIETELEQSFRLLYGAYEHLRRNDLTAISFTSALLRAPDYELIEQKVKEEIGEFRGVLEGTHHHESPVHDFLLEAHELLYWLIIGCVASQFPYSIVRLHWHMMLGYDERAAGEEEDLVQELRDFQRQASQSSACQRAGALTYGLVLIGKACRRWGISPLSVVQRDLSEMKSRPYLAPLFSGRDGC